MDEISVYNKQRWKALNTIQATLTRPAFHLDATSARQEIDPEGRLGDVCGKRVLCLASGGGHQSVSFGLLGASVTVFDLCEEQLQRDREAAAFYQLEIATEQGDMRDLSRFQEKTFDIVWHPYSINFVPDVQIVFRQVARVLKKEGLYFFQCANPFVLGLRQSDWTGEGYLLRIPYIDGEEVIGHDPAWMFAAQTPHSAVLPPKEFRHTLSTLVNGLIEHGFALEHLSDTRDLDPQPDAPVGSWEHLVAYSPPWFTLWTRQKN